MIDLTRFTRPRYIESTISVSKFVGGLITPQIARNKTVITISNVDELANYWELYISKDHRASWTLLSTKAVSEGLTYQLAPNDLGDGYYDFRVRVGAQFSVPDEVEAGAE